LALVRDAGSGEDIIAIIGMNTWLKIKPNQTPSRVLTRDICSAIRLHISSESVLSIATILPPVILPSPLDNIHYDAMRELEGIANKV
jgi:hypothetical protein